MPILIGGFGNLLVSIRAKVQNAKKNNHIKWRSSFWGLPQPLVVDAPGFEELIYLSMIFVPIFFGIIEILQRLDCIRALPAVLRKNFIIRTRPIEFSVNTDMCVEMFFIVAIMLEQDYQDRGSTKIYPRRSFKLQVFNSERGSCVAPTSNLSFPIRE